MKVPVYGVLLEMKLNSEFNILERAKKATLPLYTRATGRRRGLNPLVSRWLYTTIVRTVMMYDNNVRWAALTYQGTNNGRPVQVWRAENRIDRCTETNSLSTAITYVSTTCI